MHRALAKDRAAKQQKLVPEPCGVSAPYQAHARKRCPAVANHLVASSKRPWCTPSCAAGQSLGVRGKGMAGSQRWIMLVQLRARTPVLACVGSGFVASEKCFEAFRGVRRGWLELANTYERSRIPQVLCFQHRTRSPNSPGAYFAPRVGPRSVRRARKTGSQPMRDLGAASSPRLEAMPGRCETPGCVFEAIAGWTSAVDKIMVQFRARTPVLTCVGSAFVVFEMRF